MPWLGPDKDHMNNLSVTIGIPTYYGAPSLVHTVKSIVNSSNAPSPRIIVCVDGNPLKPKIEKQIKQLGAEVILSQQRGGQVARINQIIAMTTTDILILTQDDVRWHKHTLAKTLTAFAANADLTMAGLCELPAKATSKFERIIEVGCYTSLWIGTHWRHADNYLLASGRGLAFRTKWIKDWQLPEEVINCDAMMYFKNKFSQGTFKFLKDAPVLNPSPQTLSEHHKQARKFAISQRENQHYFKKDLSSEYQIPPVLKLRGILYSLTHWPIRTVAYLAIHIYTSIIGKNMFAHATRYWDTDISTKRTITA